jgi:hypothetical protein
MQTIPQAFIVLKRRQGSSASLNVRQRDYVQRVGRRVLLLD